HSRIAIHNARFQPLSVAPLNSRQPSRAAFAHTLFDSRRRTSAMRTTVATATGIPMLAREKLIPASDSARIHTVNAKAPTNQPAPAIHAIARAGCSMRAPEASIIIRDAPNSHGSAQPRARRNVSVSMSRCKTASADDEERAATVGDFELDRNRHAAVPPQALQRGIVLHAAPLID